jgi:hypothetical protein
MSSFVNNTGTNYTLFYNVLDYFKTIMENHPSIASATQGDIFEIDDKEFQKYPLANILITNATFADSTTIYRCQLTVADKIKLKNNDSQGVYNKQTISYLGTDDTVDIHANTLAILNDLLSYTQYVPTNFDINGDIDCEAFKDRFDNGLGGWVATFDLTTHNDRPRCLFNLLDVPTTTTTTSTSTTTQPTTTTTSTSTTTAPTTTTSTSTTTTEPTTTTTSTSTTSTTTEPTTTTTTTEPTTTTTTSTSTTSTTTEPTTTTTTSTSTTSTTTEPTTTTTTSTTTTTAPPTTTTTTTTEIPFGNYLVQLCDDSEGPYTVSYGTGDFPYLVGQAFRIWTVTSGTPFNGIKCWKVLGNSAQPIDFAFVNFGQIYDNCIECNSAPTTTTTSTTSTTTTSTTTTTAAPIPPGTYSIGDYALGGYVTYILQPGNIGYSPTQQHGLVAGIYDITSQSQWGCQGLSIPTSGSIGTGLQNTINIVNACTQSGIAARLCYDYVSGSYSDWYLPSKDELNTVWTSNAPNISQELIDIYWSSTEGPNATVAWEQDLNVGSPNLDLKTFLIYVRPMRSF